MVLQTYQAPSPTQLVLPPPSTPITTPPTPITPQSPPPVVTSPPPLSPPPPTTGVGSELRSLFTYIPTTGQSCSVFSQSDLNLIGERICKALVAALKYDPSLIKCEETVKCSSDGGRKLLEAAVANPRQGKDSIVISVVLTLMVKKGDESIAFDQTAALTKKLVSLSTASGLFDGYLAGTVLVNSGSVNGNPFTPESTGNTSSPPRSPPTTPIPSSPPKTQVTGAGTCNWKGIYQIVANGRLQCTGKKSKEYLAYDGGSTRYCGERIWLAKDLTPIGKFASFWKLNQNTTVTSPILTAGKSCPKSQNGLAGSDVKSIMMVHLSPKLASWSIRPVGSSCSMVNIVEATRERASRPSYLSSSNACDSNKLTFAAKDQGTGKQRFTLVKISD